ncbi:MAG: SpvB/TcaC N-terminal domain-containing protein, partial [Myxococcota bacterium]
MGALLSSLLILADTSAASAFDTGVSDDRVSLPEGPGALEGVGENVSVDPNMGLMRYGIPIQVPRGFDGVTPDLALSYSSGSGSDILGMGWSMRLPSIERMTMRGVPEYSEEDRFVANGGDELVRVTQGEAESSSAVYRTRFESGFVRYSWSDRSGGAGGAWKAEFPDGRVAYFGTTADGAFVEEANEIYDGRTFKYHLVELVDVYDHRMRFSYRKDGAISLVSSIEYVFTEGEPTYRVDFDYEERPDNVSDAKAGVDRTLTQRLTSVLIQVRGQQLRRYALRYEEELRSRRRSRLERVESFGSTDTRYPVVHRFDYSQGLGAPCARVDCGMPVLVDMTGNDGLGVTFQTGDANLIDINGDSLPDLLDGASARTNHRFFLSQLTSDGSHRFSSPQVSATGEVSAFTLSNPRVQFIDVNGDGFTDLLSGGTTDQKVLLNDGTGDWLTPIDLPGSAVWTGADSDLRFMDYDNDMDIDLLRSSATETFVF